MARYTGPRARVSRRLNTNIWGTAGETKALDKRPYPPGEHGRTRRRGNASEYLIQMQEKQKARFSYGLSEKQFRNLYEEANRRQGVTGELMLQLLELRTKSKSMIVVQHNIDTLDRAVPPWLEADLANHKVTVRSLPLREHIQIPVREQLIVELYSK